MPLVSVIIPTFNRANVLTRAIHSVIDQTFQDWELFVVDDASIDETTEVVASFADRRIRYLRHDKNLGAAAARNTAIELCKGEYLAFLGSDDEWLPEKLERQLDVAKRLEMEGSSNAAVISGYYSIEEGRTRKIVSIRPEWSHEDLLFMRVGPWGDAMLLVRRGIPEELYDAELRAAHDWDFLVKVARRGNITAMPEALVRVYRIAGDHVSSIDNVRKARLKIIKKYEAEFKAQPKALAVHHVRLAVVCYTLGDLRSVRLHLLSAIKAHPNDLRLYLWYLGALLGARCFRATLKLAPHKETAVETTEVQL